MNEPRPWEAPWIRPTGRITQEAFAVLDRPLKAWATGDCFDADDCCGAGRTRSAAPSWRARSSSVAGLDAVLAAERALGREPIEQTANNPGFDILSTRPGDASLRIEVKARIAGADTFVITRTEVLLALNAAPHHRLALVSVHPDGPHLDQVRYIGDLFAGAEPLWINDFGVVSQILSWDHYWAAVCAPF